MSILSRWPSWISMIIRTSPRNHNHINKSRIHIYTFIHNHIHTHIYIYIHTYIYTYIYIHSYIHTFIYIYIYMNISIDIYLFKWIYIYLACWMKSNVANWNVTTILIATSKVCRTWTNNVNNDNLKKKRYLISRHLCLNSSGRLRPHPKKHVSF